MGNEALRYVVLRGPQWSDGSPLWEIEVSAPKLKKLDGEQLAHAVNQLEDRIFPLRMLQTEPLAGRGSPAELFRRPHVVAMHVIGGHSKAPYDSAFLKAHPRNNDARYLDRGYPDGFEEYRNGSSSDLVPLYRTSELLTLAVPKGGGKPGVLKRTIFSQLRWQRKFPTFTRQMPPYWYTLSAGAKEPLPTHGAGQTVDAQFQHVIAEPLLAAGEAWPGQGADIRLPAFGLLAGAVSLAVAQGGLPWLGSLQPKAPPKRGPLKIFRYPVRLVPDGIELRTSVDFLGRGELDGWFHLGIGREGLQEHLVLSLLVERTREAGLLDGWQIAWTAAMPAPGTEEQLQGFRVAADLATVPAFRWHIPSLTGSAPDDDDYAPGNATLSGPKIETQLATIPVDIPASAVRVELLSPVGPGGIDGVVNTGGGYFRLGTKAAMKKYPFTSGELDPKFESWCEGAAEDSLMLAWASPARLGEPRSFWTIESRDGESSARLERVGSEAYACAHSAIRLADRLRQAYGLPAPRIHDEDAVDNAQLGKGRDLLPAFIPLRDGWLQLQVPNVPPDDPAKDSVDAAALADARQNILSGFLRFGNAGQLPPLYSAFDAVPERMVDEAPWQVTLEAAERLRIAIEIGKAPLSGLAVADNPDLSMRGLLWLSSDCPDALEAIPRLGAGPSAFIDVPLDRLDKETIHQGKRNLLIGLRNLSVYVKGQAVSRTGLEMSMALSQPTAKPVVPVVRWQRHPRMPLAASMPLTRSARSAVRPLESRDLVPFIATKDEADSSKEPLADLAWIAKESLPQMQDGWTYKLAAELAAMGDEALAPDESTRCRISWAAFGVPGYEVWPQSGGDRTWNVLAAPRFDLPVNDEAFATATLPPTMRSAKEQERLLAPPVFTALDWRSLAAFWGEQQRLLQLSRVAHSYLAGFAPAGQADPAEVDALVGGLKWKLQELGFSIPGAGSALPYGTMSIGTDAWSGNRALLGFSGRFSVQPDDSLKPQTDAAADRIDVLGYSPGSFLDGEFLRDARGVGVAPHKVLKGGLAHWRAVSSRVAGLVGQLTLSRPIAIASGAAAIKLWFKDLPVDARGNYIADAGRLSPAAWQDGELEQRGVEWRLTAHGSAEGFEMGDDTFPFFGLRLRPLRLEAMQFKMDGKEPAADLALTASLMAELILGPRKEDVGDGGNIVRVALKGSGAGLAIENIELSGQGVLHFPVWLLGDAQDAAREARLDVDVAAIGWDKAAQEFVMKDVSLAFGFLGSRVMLKGAKHGRDGPAMVFTWSGAAAPAGQLTVRRARLRVGKGSQLRLRHELRLAPGGAAGGRGPIAVKTVDAWGSDGGDACHWPAHLMQCCSVRVLDLRASAKFTAGPRSFAVTCPQGNDCLKSLLPGFPAGGEFHFGLVASFDHFNGESAELGAGSLSGSINFTSVECAKATMRLESIHIEARSGLRGETASGWQGRILLSGEVAGTSAIAWPAVDLGTGATVPMPPVATTITRVALHRTVWHRHTVTWLLRNHEMPFPVAACLRDRGDAIWSVAALARHTITRISGERVDEHAALVFSSVDTLTLAPMRVFAPPWPKGGHVVDLQASSTFAARYKGGADNTPDPGMAWPGRGGLGTVLQGFSGELFRKAFYAPGEPGDGRSLVVAAGFSGLVTLPGVDAAPLLRLPALVALEGSLRVPAEGEPKIRQDAGAGLEVAWVDGAAALDVVVPWRSAVATVTAAQADLEQAIDAGMRSPPGTGSRPERLFNAVLVEQCFPVSLDGSHGLAHTLYFIASAVSLARAIEHVKKEREAKAGRVDDAVASLSVVSRVSLVEISGKAYRQGAAAVLQVSQGQTALSTMPPRPPGQLHVLGDDLTRSVWLSGQVGREADGRVAVIASEMHRLPRIALVRDADGKHTAIELPQRWLRPPVRRTPDLVYADVARGYMLEPQESVLMAGVEEGWTGAVRDAASGLAAMGRVAALPAHAQGTAGGGHAVWLTQQRVPVYLPLASTVAAEPIAWMDPGSARTRVPLGAEVDSALARAAGPARALLEENAATLPAPVLWQGIVPVQAATTSVSERAGVLVARRLRLEIAACGADDKRYPFDEAFPRFGEPAQTSSSHARTERTPRPGVLPPNTADMVRNRRPCVSPLQPEVNNRAVLGSADAVRGHTQWRDVGAEEKAQYCYGAAWLMNFVACPRTCGVISDPWDGTLDLAVQVDVLEEQQQASLPVYLAAFALGADFESGTLAATASMIVNGKEFPFASLHIRDFDMGPPIPLGTGVRRGQVSLFLDMRPAWAATAAPAPAYAALAAIRNAGPVPPTVEVQFTLHPRALASLPISPLAPDARFALGVRQAIPHGKDRAPVTLRIPLFAVTRERGAMPLEPATLLFMDPAYDAGLASQPVEDALRIPEATPPALPQGRGDMMFLLSADRARVNCGASVTFMADLRFERRLPSSLAQLLEAGTGDIDPPQKAESKDPGPLVFEIHVQPRTGERREIYVATRDSGAPSRTRVKLAAVYELALATLVETDGSAAQLLAGDVVELSVRKGAAKDDGTAAQGAEALLEAKVLDAAHIGQAGQWKPVTFDLTNQNRTLRLTLTEEPVIEPPPALYAALLRTRLGNETSLSLPLYAQSPLPWRVDLPDAKADFRAGLMRRTATFVWSLLRPADERGRLAVFVVKSDRNGQTYLPDEGSAETDFRAFNKLA